MPRLAVDVVILPPEEVMEASIKENKKLKGDPIILDKENCLPHISLCMGVIKEEDLPKAKRILSSISKNFKGFPLKINFLNGEKSCFEFQKSNELQEIHEEIMNKMLPLLSYDAKTGDCFSPPIVVEKTVFWINNYKGKSSFENFYPHITLGVGEMKSKKVNLEFKASKLALCHLGNYCTCRKVLATFKL